MSAAKVVAPTEEIQETQFTSISNSRTVQSVIEDEAPNPSSSSNGHLSEQNGRKAQTPAGGYGSFVPQQNHTSALNSSDVPAVTVARVLAPDLLRGLLMILQSIDHAALILGAWRHGTGIESEGDGTVVTDWNIPVAWVARMLTHLCAPGFMFLLGMGVVYLERSRSKLGWSSRRIASHFAVRALVLAAISEALGVFVTAGRILVFNIVLLALAVNYLLAGLIWLALKLLERRLADAIDRTSLNDDTSQPLLQDERPTALIPQPSRGAKIAWHLNSLILLGLAAVTCWWNIWLSPDHGHCNVDSLVAEQASKHMNPFFAFWFYSVQFGHVVVSPFPPLAWLSFAIIGLLYAHIVLGKNWSPAVINAFNAVVGAVLALAFALTRLLHFGNLSEGCLHMPEHVAQPDKNQYLTSFRAFFYVVKYPPSPAYCKCSRQAERRSHSNARLIVFYTMSFNFLLLAFFGALPANLAKRIPTLMTFGTSALFFYIVHMLLYGVMSIPIKKWFGHPLGYYDPIADQPAIGVGNTAPFCVSWLLGLAILYPLCRWYGRFKRSKGPNSIWRFF